MGTNWATSDYFSMLLSHDKRGYAALEMLVDDLHADKEKTISRFLCHSGSEDFLWGLARHLGNQNARVAGNAAFILGTLAESELGCFRVISLTGGKNGESQHILADLTNMLKFDDPESVMNAAGTMGTLAESHDGRAWMLADPGLDATITHITNLLGNDNLWTASNAALVLARLTIAEEGCDRLLKHQTSGYILSQLISSLGVDKAGRGMNAAFAIGRLCDLESGRNRLLSLPESEKMITQLAKMLCCTDTGASKNACFALSCLATNKDGHKRLLQNFHSNEVIRTLSELLSAEDAETGWFAAMTLRTLASQPKGCLRLREHTEVLTALQAIKNQTGISGDLREEVLTTLDILKCLEKPAPPQVEVTGPSEVQVTWNEMTTKSGLKISYQLYNGSQCIYSGKALGETINTLQPFTTYNFRVRASTEGDHSPLSDPTVFTTEESVPEAPQNLRILGVTTTQLRIGWEPPEKINGNLRGYCVINGKTVVEHTMELSSIISGLQPSTTYDIHVCASTVKGKGPKETIYGTTSDMGAHAPSKPDVTVRGRNELSVSWRAPEVPLGRISRYDLSMNGKVVYSGTELSFTVLRLTPDTEYTFIVSAITNEGKCESKPAKKKTAKDEYEGERAPLYQPPTRRESDAGTDGNKSTSTKKRKAQLGHSGSEVREVNSARTFTRSNSATEKKHAGKHKEGRSSLTSDLTDSTRPVTASDTLKSARRERRGRGGPAESGEQEVHRGAEGDPRHEQPRRQSQARSNRRSSQSHLLKSQDSSDFEHKKINVKNQRKSMSSEDDHSDSHGSLRQGNEVLTVEVQQRLSETGHSRSSSGDSDIRGVTKRSPRLDMDSDRLKDDVSSRSSKRGSVDSDPAWIAHTQRYDNQEITRMFSTLPMNSLYSPAVTKQKPGFIELELPSAPPATSKLGPTRANTFVAPTRHSSKMVTDKPSGHRQKPKSPSHQWVPDLPTQAETQVKNRNKFIPMQFRTQPLNLPANVRREATSLGLFQEKGPRRLESLSRNPTKLDLSRAGMSNLSLTSQRLTKDRLVSARSFPGQLAPVSATATQSGSGSA